MTGNLGTDIRVAHEEVGKVVDLFGRAGLEGSAVVNKKDALEDERLVLVCQIEEGSDRKYLRSGIGIL